jgi:hypothetical protein
MHCEAGKTRPVNKTAEEATSIVRHSSLAINGDVVDQVEVVAEHPRIPFKLEVHNVPGACRLINEWELLSGNQQSNKRGCAGTCDLTMSSISASFTACNVALPAPFVMLSLTLTVKFCDMLVYKFQTIKIWLLAGFGCPRLSVQAIHRWLRNFCFCVVPLRRPFHFVFRDLGMWKGLAAGGLLESVHLCQLVNSRERDNVTLNHRQRPSK